jgi:hypothetical protein
LQFRRYPSPELSHTREDSSEMMRRLFRRAQPQKPTH